MRGGARTHPGPRTSRPPRALRVGGVVVLGRDAVGDPSRIAPERTHPCPISPTTTHLLLACRRSPAVAGRAAQPAPRRAGPADGRRARRHHPAHQRRPGRRGDDPQPGRRRCRLAGPPARHQDPLVVGEFGPSYGQTADVVLALSAAKVGKGTAAAATKALRSTCSTTPAAATPPSTTPAPSPSCSWSPPLAAPTHGPSATPSGPTWSPGCAPSSAARSAPAAPPPTAAASATSASSATSATRSPSRSR